tara:strand:- start:28264 stop:28632 length:369 start_codon:yes stop_codon:yes gene_type:complete
MKNLSFLLLFTVSLSFANNENTVKQNTPKIGDVLVINAPDNNTYNHIDFPKLNFIVKKGGLATYKNVFGKHVVIKDIINKDDGSTHVILENKDNSKFFRYLKHVKADYHKSLEAGEISKVKY